MHVYLVRHSIVAPVAERPGEQWYLSQDGRQAADALALAPYWATLKTIYTSSEPKAVTTAQRIAAPNELPIQIEHDLGEAGGRAWVETGYADQVHAYLSGNRPEGWEPLDEARTRVRRCIDAIVEEHSQLDVGVVSHGIALTLYLSGAMNLRADEAIELWENIRFPDVAIFDPARKRFLREFGG